jgi:hypothetical protein
MRQSERDQPAGQAALWLRTHDPGAGPPILGSGNAGNGVLRCQGSTYPFSVGGLGVGGIGISKIEAKGEVYGLQRLRDFPGAYVQGRWLRSGQHERGRPVAAEREWRDQALVAKRQGLMLSLGGDAVVISMNR